MDRVKCFTPYPVHWHYSYGNITIMLTNKEGCLHPYTTIQSIALYYLYYTLIHVYGSLM